MTETVVLVGTITPTILSVASSYRADLIVIGWHRARGRPHWLNGHVAERFARHTSVPELILRQGGPPLIDFHRNGVTARHILVPLDGSALAKAILALVASLRAALAASSCCTLHLMRIVHPDEVKQNARALEAAQRYLSAVVAHHALGPETICSVAIQADVATALIAMAGQGKQAKSMMERAVVI
jgi:nucleotide-binding universal stress UspA family protein